MRSVNRLLQLGALALVAGLLAALTNAGAQGPAKVSIRGTIMKVTPAPAKGADLLATVLIEGARDKTTDYDKAVVKITSKTKLEKKAGGKKVAAKVEDLKEGMKVESIFTGPVAESYPVQSTAGALLIVADKK